MSRVMPDWFPRHRITADEYHRMAAIGFLAPDARVELIEGEIFEMPPMGSHHTALVHQLRDLLAAAVGEQAAVRVQSPLQLGPSSEPEPDLALVQRRTDYYATSHPTAADTFLVIEVSETTLSHDRTVKQPLYARHGIPELWIVDMKSSRLHVFRSPADGSYTRASSTAEPGRTALDALPGAMVDLTGVLIRASGVKDSC